MLLPSIDRPAPQACQPSIYQMTERLSSVIERVETVPCHLSNTYRLILTDGNYLYCKTKPSTNALLMRSEQYSLENEIAVRQIFPKSSISVPEITYLERGHSKTKSPLLIMSGRRGILLAEYNPSSEEEQQVASQLDAIRKEISAMRSSQFGAAALVARDQGYKRWHEAFQEMVEDLLEDGEDVLLNLPYAEIRNLVSCCSPTLEEPGESSLLVRGFDQTQNILVDKTNGILEIVGFDCLADAIWVDPHFKAPRQCSDGASTSQLLYCMYDAILEIVEGFYHSTSGLDDSIPRRELTICLMKLSDRLLGEK